MEKFFRSVSYFFANLSIRFGCWRDSVVYEGLFGDED